MVTAEVLELVPRKRAEDNKYSAGAVLVVGGSPGMTGAICLTATAALRADAGYVTVCAPPESLPVIETRVLEAVKRQLDDAFDAVSRHSALALGPGLGRTEERRALVRRLLEETDLPAVVDADALFGLEPFSRSAPTILTPHSGELGRLLGRESAWVDAHRLAAAGEAAERFGCICLLKGADTLVAVPEAGSFAGKAGKAGEARPESRGASGAPGEGVLVCPLRHPSLATAGSGDVLTGIAAAFLAKGMDARLAAAAAAIACDAAAGLGPERGLVASDVVELLPRALGERRRDDPV
jgi:NAD(P)H-hydrate epimerase